MRNNKSERIKLAAIFQKNVNILDKAGIPFTVLIG
jgi:hypothetical protein